jgi:putative ABC transport system ATP-binding protein
MIHLENVCKIYRTARKPVRALSNVTLSIAPGEFVAVRGPSGCGKSTLLMVVGGLGRPTSGRVVVAGEELSATSAAALTHFRAHRVGFVFQMFHLLPYLTIVDNVVAAAPAGQSAAARHYAGQLLEKFHLADRLHHHPGELSAGERQRVAIARAMVNRPQLILADEPTGNLDHESAEGVLQLLADFHRDGGTVLLVTHQEQAAGYAQRAVLLQNGAIVGGDGNGQTPPA